MDDSTSYASLGETVGGETGLKRQRFTRKHAAAVVATGIFVGASMFWQQFSASNSPSQGLSLASRLEIKLNDLCLTGDDDSVRWVTCDGSSIWDVEMQDHTGYPMKLHLAGKCLTFDWQNRGKLRMMDCHNWGWQNFMISFTAKLEYRIRCEEGPNACLVGADYAGAEAKFDFDCVGQDDYHRADGVGGWGGGCKCPDGVHYFVGDRGDGCQSLACYNGVAGSCERSYEAFRAGWQVTCSTTTTTTTTPAHCDSFTCSGSKPLNKGPGFFCPTSDVSSCTVDMCCTAPECASTPGWTGPSGDCEWYVANECSSGSYGGNSYQNNYPDLNCCGCGRVPRTKCLNNVDGTADIILVLDASGSVGSQYWQRTLAFAADLVGRLTTSGTGLRIGVVRFSTYAETMIQLTDSQDKDQLQTTILGLSYTNGGTATDKALNLAKTMFDRDVRKMVILFSDGQSNYRTATLAAGQALKNAHATITTVGVGNNIRHSDELALLASSSGGEYYTDFNVANAVAPVGVQNYWDLGDLVCKLTTDVSEASVPGGQTK